MDAKYLDAWMRFLGGRWMPGRPTSPGVYKTADLEGNQTGVQALAYRTQDGVIHVHDGLAFFWSEPTPVLPPVFPSTDE